MAGAPFTAAAPSLDFSVEEADVRAWLGNPDFTPYPAIAEALLSVLAPRPLRQPVFLDVIVYNYEHAPGAVSPRRRADVDVTRLKAAIVEGYNSRHGEALADFTRTLE